MSVPVLTHRRDLRQGDLVFPEEILRIGHTLDFQLDCVSKEVQQEVFGSELDTSSLCDWLNLHTAYDFALQDVADHIEITLCRNFGKKAHPFLYPLNRAERDVLRGEMEACCQRRTDRSLAQQYSHLLTTEEAEPPELTVGTHRLPMGEVGFAEDLSECGGLLQFYMPVTFDPDAVFGTHVATAENDDWLNVYAAYDLNASRPCSALDVILVCGDGNEFAFRYPLAKQEQAALLEKMDPAIRFTGKGSILPSSNRMSLLFESVNFARARVRVRKIFANNLLQFFQRNYYGDTYFSDMEYVSRIVRDTTIDLGDKASTRLDRTNSYSLDLSRLITDSRKSMYLLEIKGVDPLIPVESNDYDYYFGDYRTYAERSKVVIQSDIGIICKSSGDGELIVYTTDLVSARPKGSCKVRAYDRQNQQLAEAVTDSEGPGRCATEAGGKRQAENQPDERDGSRSFCRYCKR